MLKTDTATTFFSLSFSLLIVDGRNNGWLYFVKAQTSVTCDGDGVVDWVPAAVQNFLVEAHFRGTGGAPRAEGGLLQGAGYIHCKKVWKGVVRQGVKQKQLKYAQHMYEHNN